MVVCNKMIVNNRMSVYYNYYCGLKLLTSLSKS